MKQLIRERVSARCLLGSLFYHDLLIFPARNTNRVEFNNQPDFDLPRARACSCLLFVLICLNWLIASIIS